MTIAGTYTDVVIVGYYGWWLGICASVWVLTGWGGVRALRVPALLIFLVVPLPYLLANALTVNMQLWSTHLGVGILRQLGYPGFQSGNLIEMGSFQPLVAEACFGLRYLYPLISIGVVVAHCYRGTLWQNYVFSLA